MGGFTEVVVRGNPELSSFIDGAGVGDDLREKPEKAVVLENSLDEESVCVAHDLQLASGEEDRKDIFRWKM